MLSNSSSFVVMGYLHGDILSLRAIEPRDWEFLLQVENDSNEWIQSENYLPFSKSVMQKYVNGEQDIVKFGQYRFMIQLNPGGESIGCIDLFNYNAVHSRAGVGIYIANEFRTHGYAKEALRLLSKYGKEVLNLELLYCSILETNKASVSVFKSQKFEISGERKAWSKVGGKRVGIKLLQREL